MKNETVGLNTASVVAIRMAVYGSKVSVFRDKHMNEEYDITIRYPQESRQNIEDIEISFNVFSRKNIPLQYLPQWVQN